MRHRHGATARRQRSEDFLFSVKLADAHGTRSGLSHTSGAESLSTLSVSSSEVVSGFMVTSVGTMMALQAGAGSSAVMACIPFLPSWSQGSFSQDALSQAPGPVSQRLRLLSHLVNGAALAQLTTAMLQFALNDPLSGLIGGGIAAIGWQTAHPAGFRLLPTYVVLSFCHGIMQVLLNLQLLASGVPLKAMTAVQAGFMGKVAVGTLLASPLVMFLGMGTGYWLHKESQELLRSLEPTASPDPAPAIAPPAVPTAVPPDSPMASGTPAASPASPTPRTPGTPVPPPAVSPSTEDLRPPAPKKAVRIPGKILTGPDRALIPTPSKTLQATSHGKEPRVVCGGTCHHRR
eukprot:s4615_g4.t1